MTKIPSKKRCLPSNILEMNDQKFTTGEPEKNFTMSWQKIIVWKTRKIPCFFLQVHHQIMHLEHDYFFPSSAHKFSLQSVSKMNRHFLTTLTCLFLLQNHCNGREEKSYWKVDGLSNLFSVFFLLQFCPCSTWWGSTIVNALQMGEYPHWWHS